MRDGNGRQQALLAASALAVVPTAARAHLDSTGMGPVYDGVAHLVTSPEDLVAVVALALFVGQRGTREGRIALSVLPVAWLAGGIAGLTASTTGGGTILSALWLLLLGVFVAADAGLPGAAIAGLTALLGLHHGYLNGSGMGQTAAAIVALLGVSASVFALVALAAAFAASVRARWARIAVRVAGSWIAASGLLLLGWAARIR